jgi:hypothetical protein
MSINKNFGNQDFISKNKVFFGILFFSPWVISATWLHTGTPLKFKKKMNLLFILNKNSLQAHIELDFGMLGVATKHVKYVVHLFKRIEFKIFLLTGCPKTNNQFLVPRNFRG